MTGRSIDRKDLWTYVLLASMAMIYVIARAWMVPLAHDEARTFFLYNEVGRFQPWYAYWDAANHLLCTALAQVTYLCFGPVAWSLRLPSVLSFGVYLWYVWRTGVLLQHRPVRWIFWAAMVLMPMLIEFFSLYRGYGMGIAFFLMAVFHLLRFARTGERIHFLGALGGMLLATFASFSLMVLWAAALALLALLAFRWGKSICSLLWSLVWLVVLGVMPLAYLASYCSGLAVRGAFYYGTSNGLLHGTIPSLLKPLFPDLGRDLSIPVAASALFLIFVAMVQVARYGRGRLAVSSSLIALLLLLEIIGRYMLNSFFDVLFPVDRAALHLVTLLVLLFAFILDGFSGRRPVLRYAAVALLVFPVTMVRHANLDHVSFWPDDPIKEGVFHAAEDQQRKAQRPLSIGSSEFLRFSWALRNLAARSELPLMQNVPDGCTGTDLLLLHVADTVKAPEYHRIAGKPTDPVVLCARNSPLPLMLLLDTVLPPNALVPESWMLWDPPEGRVHCPHLLLVLEAVISSTENPLEALVVWETAGPADSLNSYTELNLAMQRSNWHGDTLGIARWVPLSGQRLQRFHVRFWNIRNQPFSVGYCRLRAYCIDKR